MSAPHRPKGIEMKRSYTRESYDTLLEEKEKAEQRLEQALRSYEATKGDSILLPTRPSDVITPRTYYNRYLNTKLSNSLFDGKQLVLFELVPLKSSSGPEQRKAVSEKIAGALGALSLYCPQDTLSNIYAPLRKAL